MTVIEKTIQNTKLHTDVAVLVSEFGEDGSVRLVPVIGDQPGRPFILDPAAAAELGATLTHIAAVGIGREWIAKTS